jgi:hypothetical protein
MNALEAISRAVDLTHQVADKSPRVFWRAVRDSAPSMVVLTLLGLLLSTAGVPRALSRAALDAVYVGARARMAERVFVVLIDATDDRVLLSNRRPFPDAVLERLIQSIAVGGPSVIVVDLPTPQNSAELKLSTIVPVVWQLPWNESLKVAEATLSGAIAPGDDSAGVSLAPLDTDGIVRGHRRTVAQADGTVVNTIVKAAVSAAGERGILRSADEVLVTVPYRIPRLAAGEVIKLAETATSAWRGDAAIRGRVVVLSSYSAQVVATSRGPRAGYEVVADAIESELQHTVASTGSVLSIGTAQAIAMVLVIVAYRRWRLRAAVWVTVVAIPVIAAIAGLVVFGSVSAAPYFAPFLVLVLLQQLYAKASIYARAFERLEKSAAPTQVEQSSGAAR